MKRKYKVRFHLGKGENYMKWRVENVLTGEVVFHDPEEVTILMINAFLRNQKGGAQKIFDGGDKTVVAWIEAETVSVIPPKSFADFIHVRYNPRVTPNWTVDGINVDSEEFEVLATDGRNVIL